MHMLTVAETPTFSSLWPKYWCEEKYGEFCAWIARWTIAGRGRHSGRPSMAKLKPKELKKWEASRDLVAEIERSIREMKVGKAAREHYVKVPEVVSPDNSRKGF